MRFNIWATQVNNSTIASQAYANSRFPSFTSSFSKSKFSVPCPEALKKLFRDPEIAWNLILSNLYSTARVDYWLRVSLSKNYYVKTGVNYDHVVAVLGWLAENDHIEGIKGYHNNGFGLVSAFRFKKSSSIYAALCDAHARNDLAWSIRTPEKAVVVKTQFGEVVEVKDPALQSILDKERILLETWMQQLANHTITVQNCQDPYINSITTEDTEGNRDVSHLIAPKIIYNNQHLNQGGRCYYMLQNMKREDRKNIKIDGEQVVELDYKSMHINILANLAGQALDFDPYEVCSDLGVSREHQKSIMNRMLNAKYPMKSLKFALADFGYSRYEVDADEYMARLCAALPFLKEGFSRQRVGLSLMKIEADVMKAVLSFGVSQEIPILPIHDGFVCKRSDMQQVLFAMGLMYSVVLFSETGYKNHSCAVSIKS